MKGRGPLRLLPIIAVAVSESAATATVRGEGVEYLGIENATSGINTFFGIKYAEAPVGPYRWRPPVPVDYSQSPETTYINATIPGDGCLQSVPPWSSGFTLLPGLVQGYSEDCLLLNVQVPTNPKSSKLAVLVNIHGGGYIAGTARDAPGDSLVYHANGSLIYVAVQYRLGSWGFLAGDEIKEDGTANAGLLDQRAALEWVQRNIHYFGGDPEKVTITGGSAGGGSVAMHMVMNGGDWNPPQADYAWMTPMFDDQWQNIQYSYFLKGADCCDVACLRGRTTNELLNAEAFAYFAGYGSRQFGYGDFYWGPVIDGHIIRGHPFSEFRKGHFTKVPTLVTRNGYEGIMFTNQSIVTVEDSTNMLKTLWQDGDGTYVDIVRKLYPSDEYNSTLRYGLNIVADSGGPASSAYNFPDEFMRTQAVFGDALINCATTLLANAVATDGVASFKLVFNAGYQLHGATGPFVFNKDINPDGSLDIGFGYPIGGNTTLAGYMRDWYVSFVLNLEPNGYTYGLSPAPHWPRYGSGGHEVMYVEKNAISAINDPEKSCQCKFLEMGRGNGYQIWPQW
ncbi:uncharacterized protein JN550_009662 [Neoarthrinium moseri]|uniref:uncharacterized protein n=1 Tax=Neoarthrinium moseri TaxID=1658444 RepID=UPI001FDC2DE2|nr:uncharacterized protein JN550_009662 [Neoarthrinium moseri]KAI1863342.1 hypothetical protein JN550_009662 [Neoarthrinium moseri]